MQTDECQQPDSSRREEPTSSSFEPEVIDVSFPVALQTETISASLLDDGTFLTSVSLSSNQPGEDVSSEESERNQESSNIMRKDLHAQIQDFRQKQEQTREELASYLSSISERTKDDVVQPLKNSERDARKNEIDAKKEGALQHSDPPLISSGDVDSFLRKALYPEDVDKQLELERGMETIRQLDKKLTQTSRKLRHLERGISPPQTLPLEKGLKSALSEDDERRLVLLLGEEEEAPTPLPGSSLFGLSERSATRLADIRRQVQYDKSISSSSGVQFDSAFEKAETETDDIGDDVQSVLSKDAESRLQELRCQMQQLSNESSPIGSRAVELIGNSRNHLLNRPVHPSHQSSVTPSNPISYENWHGNPLPEFSEEDLPDPSNADRKIQELLLRMEKLGKENRRLEIEAEKTQSLLTSFSLVSSMPENAHRPLSAPSSRDRRELPGLTPLPLNASRHLSSTLLSPKLPSRPISSRPGTGTPATRRPQVQPLMQPPSTPGTARF